MSKARTLADFISDGSEFADGTISVAEVSGAAPLASPTFTGSVTVPNLTSTGNINLGDDDEIRLGNNDDFQLFHDGFHTRLYNNTGDLHIRNLSDDKKVLIQTDDGSGGHTNYFIADGTTGETQLHHLGSEKLSTSSTGVEVTGKTTTDELDLNAIAATISDTAVDIFVYDTRKDSDGGAWRKRTQHTSWYNETLNTATRGSRKEFPAVAVIVAESNQVTIYDGDDPDLPMWMVFTWTTGYNLLGYGDRAKSSVAAKNGRVVTGANTGGDGVYWVDFIADHGRRIYQFEYVSTGEAIAQRTGTTHRTLNTSTLIVNSTVNDVAMTVLPNAPIDAATGLPVPTIAVATDGGVSVIKDDGTVVDSVAFYARDLNFNKAYDLWVSEYQFSDDVRFFEYPSYLSEGFGLTKSFLYATVPPLNWDGNSSRYEQPTPTSNTDVSILSNVGLQRISYNRTSPDDSMVNVTGHDYNTGWMNGDIKLATLSDTDATNVTGAEGLTGSWATPSGYDNTTSGTGTSVTGTGNTTQTRSYLVVDGVDIGETFVVEVTIDTLSSGSMTIYARTGTTGTGGPFIGQQTNALVGNTYTFTVTATTDDFNLLLVTNTNGADFTATCSVRLAEEDRSVNGNGLQVFGTVTKSAVATGADLVAYTDFADNTNYFYQPPNADMDFGTGDFSVMLWHYHEDATLNDTIYFASGRSSEYSWQVGAAGSDSSYLWIIGGAINARSAANSVIEQAWTHLTYVRRNGVTEIWVNGVLIETDTDTTDLNSNLGIEMPLSSSAGDGNDWMSLFRISATAPSPEQIKKIYEDEKVLFQENAQATLYGSSDAVTALAYDDTTELLHVGTSAGRSVFQGLRRVDNTTTAVGAAISASNGLVADE